MNGPADLQKVWHDFVGNYFSNITILDVGSGQGHSHARLSINKNRVTTSDINRNLMLQLDIISEPRDIYGVWDLVTAFDVIEHVSRPIPWLRELKRLAADYVFITTPNKLIYENPWHYCYEELIRMIKKVFPNSTVKIFGRYKGRDFDHVKGWDGKEVEKVHYFGFMILGVK